MSLTHEYFLQIKFKNRNNSLLLDFWDMQEPYAELDTAKRDAKELIDDTVLKARIFNHTLNKVVMDLV